MVKSPRKRCLPLINRGYFSRVHTVDKVLLRFLEAADGNSVPQIVSLGAGMDSTFFKLRSKVCPLLN